MRGPQGHTKGAELLVDLALDDLRRLEECVLHLWGERDRGGKGRGLAGRLNTRTHRNEYVRESCLGALRKAKENRHTGMTRHCSNPGRGLWGILPARGGERFLVSASGEGNCALKYAISSPSPPSTPTIHTHPHTDRGPDSPGALEPVVGSECGRSTMLTNR